MLVSLKASRPTAKASFCVFLYGFPPESMVGLMVGLPSSNDQIKKMLYMCVPNVWVLVDPRYNQVDNQD